MDQGTEDLGDGDGDGRVLVSASTGVLAPLPVGESVGC